MSRATLRPPSPIYKPQVISVILNNATTHTTTHINSHTNMQPSSSTARTPSKPPPRRARSESDRKKHAGWRRCPRCARSVSTNGRNFYHHMHKCDRHFFADIIARIDASRTTPTPAPQPQTTRLTDAQRTVFLQQLCFLRIYDRTVDDVFRTLEAAHVRFCGASVFETIRHAKRQQAKLSNHQTPHDSTPVPAPQRASNKYAAIPLPDTLASPMSIPTASPSTPAHLVGDTRTHLHPIPPPVFSPSAPAPSNLTQLPPPPPPSLPCSPSPHLAVAAPVSIPRPISLTNIPISFHHSSPPYVPQSPPPELFLSQPQQSPIYASHRDSIHVSSPLAPISSSPYHSSHPQPSQLIENLPHDYLAPIPLSSAQLQPSFQHVSLQMPVTLLPSPTAIVSPTLPATSSTQLPLYHHSVQQSTPHQPTSSQPPSSRQTSAMSISSVINK